MQAALAWPGYIHIITLNIKIKRTAPLTFLLYSLNFFLKILSISCANVVCRFLRLGSKTFRIPNKVDTNQSSKSTKIEIQRGDLAIPTQFDYRSNSRLVRMCKHNCQAPVNLPGPSNLDILMQTQKAWTTSNSFLQFVHRHRES